MCGIAGIFQINGPIARAQDKIKNMVGQLFHRGPDECGFYFDYPIAMGMTRLSIIDVAGGSQPICNESEDIWVVFNGEIFNYKELRVLLEKFGHRFKTSSDTEVIVHSYEQWGEDFIRYLNGQFAISLWDRKKRQLLLARDRLGIRPLFYAFFKNKLIFASEIKAIFAEGSINPEVDFSGLNDIFTFWVTLPPRTAFKKINELPPGRMLTVDHRGVKETEYWDIPFQADVSDKKTTILQEELENLLTDAVRIRLRADVPVGAYLSGGLDSSIITALVNKIHRNKLKTFSVNFTDQAYDEQFYQETLISQLNTEHRSMRVDAVDILRHFHRVVWLAEKPMLRLAPAPLLALSSMVNGDGFKVVLTGEGADEFFAGYNIFKETRVRCFWAREPEADCRPLLLSRIYPYILSQQGTLNPFWQAFFKRHLQETENPFYSHLLRWENTAKIRHLLSEPIKSSCNYEDQLARAEAYLSKLKEISSPLSRAQYIEAKLFMNGYLLSSQGDRMLMGHSVEGRFPFLDHRVVAFAATLPEDLRLRGLNEKFLLKKTFKKILPSVILQRPKQPYRAPVSKNLFGHPELEWIEAFFRPQTLEQYGYFDPTRVGILKQKIIRQQTPLSLVDEMAIVAILSTQLWHFHFFEDLNNKAEKLPEKQKIVDQREA
ncbi:asparagine synthase (glutamine-hydrolyzing) [Caldithrix abyssi DSM 13497]|uniref:asparagine synthase (glutamine-hydrolyzing) n=1 Tax=Caldithrix abyssi DSM 13497 TaxID=880073 RepID=H1XUC3_CALAY|nr:asparagine synthase (glutamine-hydrolyzing) [Caldithrix abyssi]APF18771.1 asparagine synthase (glutamine-hydrolysing) [Caldithrix abyssi DSM 13497]EHO42749.1 asparagine synthase (glutamine-hydrolyzing) [Caldithrix abyssi DSM 13497]